MAEAGAAKPVPIRLAQRYPNGSMISYSARAIARDDDSVRVLVNEEFETGIKLAVMAPFLDGLTTARVHSVTRSKKQPGYFEVLLRIGEDTISAVRLKADIQNDDSEKRESGADRGPEGGEGVVAEQIPCKPSAVVPELAVEAAERLAYELRHLPTRKLSQVLDELPSGLRSMSLLVAIAAAIHLLQQKGHVEARRLLDNLTGSADQSAKEAVRQ